MRNNYTKNRTMKISSSSKINKIVPNDSYLLLFGKRKLKVLKFHVNNYF